jgi:Fe-S-cluster containining protein
VTNGDTTRWSHGLPSLLEQESQSARESLEAPRTEDTASVFVFDAAARANRFLPLLAEVACRPGCDHCCHGIKVDVTAAEALAVAAFVTDGLDGRALSALRDRVTRHAAAVKAMTLDERLEARTPCPVLDEVTGTCGAYDVRPMRCRSHHSLDAAACKRALENPREAVLIDKYVDVVNIHDALIEGQKKALAEEGLDHGTFDLALALGVALSEPGAADRWARGERLFDAAAYVWPDEDVVPDGAVLRSLGVSAPKPAPKWRSSSQKKNHRKRK